MNDLTQIRYELEVLLEKRRQFVNKWWVRLFLPKFIRNRYETTK